MFTSNTYQLQSQSDYDDHDDDDDDDDHDHCDVYDYHDHVDGPPRAGELVVVGGGAQRDAALKLIANCPTNQAVTNRHSRSACSSTK